VTLPSSLQKHAFASIILSPGRWHQRLGHPSHDVVCSSLANNESICDACLQAKAHQLPYPVSTNHATTPLELIFSDVWGPAIDSFNGKKYYVFFIDDFSKFIWIYLLCRKSKLFKYFHEFQ
jgi:hypothetical protein